MAKILEAAHHPNFLAQVEEIFWETSARHDFTDQAEKVAFQDRYLNCYTRDYPEHVLVAVQGERVLGYVLGVMHTLEAKSILTQTPHLEVFRDLYERYPAHLHINFRAEARGQGLGSELITAFTSHVVANGVSGLHLITSPSARNVSFYQKNGFLHRVERLWNGRPLLLLGKNLLAKSF